MTPTYDILENLGLIITIIIIAVFLKLFNITLFCDWGKKLTKKRTGWDSYQRTDKKNSKDYRMKGTEMFDLQYSNK